MRIDANAFLGDYPFRRVAGGTPKALLAAMARTGIGEAWVSNLAAVLWKDPTEGNAALYQAAHAHRELRPVPAVHPELANWKDVLSQAVQRRAPCVRADPMQYGIDPVGAEMRSLVANCARMGLTLQMAVRFEDGRQRHPNDRSGELTPAAVRELIRLDPRGRLFITHADREFVEQVHFGSTPAEAERILWDIGWIWGPPEDHLALLLRTIGVPRFAFGTAQPLRIPENSLAKLDLLDLSPEDRAAIEGGNLAPFALAAKPR